MNILDENIFFGQRELLRLRKVHFRQIGVEIGYAGMKDRNEVIPLLQSLRRPTLFTSDKDFYRSDWRHAGYCLVISTCRRTRRLNSSSDSCDIEPFALRRNE